MTDDIALSSPQRDWPLTAADHKIDVKNAQVLIDAYAPPPGYGAYFTSATIKALITPPNAGIRYYFTIHNKTVTVMLTGVQRLDTGRYDDLFNAKLAVSHNLNVTAPNTDQSITLRDASACNRNYRASSDYAADKRKGGMFGIAAIKEIMVQTGYSGIRFYFGKDAAGVKTIVIYGVDSAGQNLTKYIGDQNAPCPNFCGVVNQLNS